MNLLFWKKPFKKFQSDFGWFEMQLPSNWEQYEDAEGTYAFYDPKLWKGNFRITPLQVNNTIDDDFLDSDFAEGYIEKYLGNYRCTYYKKVIENENLVLYYWHFHKHNLLFICSYTTNTEYDSTSAIAKEIDTAETIIKSITLL